MSNIIEEETKSIVGISIKTRNMDAINSMPPLWGKFFEEGIADTISGKVSDDIYAVYTNFENEGVNNEGEYRFLIGVEVEEVNTLKEGLDSVSIPKGHYHKFPVRDNKAEEVFCTWMNIWSKEDIGKTFLCDFEMYAADGDISINVGTNQSD